MVGLFSQEPSEGGKLDLAGGLGASHDSQGLLLLQALRFPLPSGFPGEVLPVGGSRATRDGNFVKPTADPAIPVA